MYLGLTKYTNQVINELQTQGLKARSAKALAQRKALLVGTMRFDKIPAAKAAKILRVDMSLEEYRSLYR